MANANYPRPLGETKLRPYAGDLSFGTFLAFMSGLACLWAAMGCLTDELSPAGGRAFALRLLFVARNRLPWDEVQTTALVALCILVLSSIRLVGAIGLTRSRRWGFYLCGTLGVLFAVGGACALPNPFGAAGALYGAAVGTYCFRRLRGQDVSRFA